MSLKNDPLLSLKIDPPLLSPSRGSGSVKIPKKHPPYYLSSASIPEAPALIAGLNNFAVMRQPIQQRSGHLLVTKHRRPFPKGQIRSNHNGHPLVELRDQVKQQLTATSGKWQIPQLVQDHEVAAQQLLRQSPLTSLTRLRLQLIDQIHHIVKPPCGTVSDAHSCHCHRQMRLASAGAADQNHIAVRLQQPPVGQLMNQSLTHRAERKIKVTDVFRHR